MLRITKINQAGKAGLKLEGRVTEPWIQELEQVCEEHGRPLVVDLSGVTFADDRGVAVIRRLRDEGAELLGRSLLLSELVDRRQ